MMLADTHRQDHAAEGKARLVRKNALRIEIRRSGVLKSLESQVGKPDCWSGVR